MILESNKEFNIIFIQEPSWLFIRSISSFLSEEGESLVGTPNYPDWITFSRTPSNNNDSPRVICYINI